MSNDSEDKTIIFICRNCGEHMKTTLGDLMEAPDREIWAPNLCPACGKYPPDKLYDWMSRAMGGFTIRREFGSGRHEKHGWRHACRVARTRTEQQTHEAASKRRWAI